MLINTPASYKQAIHSLYARSGLEHNPALAIEGPRSLLEHARASLWRSGGKSLTHKDTSDKTPDEVFAAAFSQSESDFPVLLADLMHKTIQTAFRRQAHTWRRFCSVGHVSDFRDHHRIRESSLPDLKKVGENGEFAYARISDAEGARVRAGTKGLILNISRHALVNDDLAALTDLPRKLGEAAARTLESDVYAVLGLNGGRGPVLDDGLTLFHASRGNYVAGGQASAPSYASLVAGMAAMRRVKDVGGNDFLDLMPRIWLGPLDQQGAVRQLNEGEHYADPQTALAKANGFKGTLTDIVGSPRVPGTAWRMFAPINEAPALEVSFLDGNEEPKVTVLPGFEVDGIRALVCFDYGVSALDWRGAFMNEGA